MSVEEHPRFSLKVNVEEQTFQPQANVEEHFKNYSKRAPHSAKGSRSPVAGPFFQADERPPQLLWDLCCRSIAITDPLPVAPYRFAWGDCQLLKFYSEYSRPNPLGVCGSLSDTFPVLYLQNSCRCGSFCGNATVEVPDGV